MNSSNEPHPEQYNRPEQTPATVFITSLLIASLSHAITAKAETKLSKSYVRGKAWPGGLKATTEVPDDPALPALAAMRAAGVTGAIRAPGLGDGPVELLLRGYSPGSRATFEARSGGVASQSRPTRRIRRRRRHCTRRSPRLGWGANRTSAFRRCWPGIGTCGSWSSAGWKGQRWESWSRVDRANAPANWPHVGYGAPRRSP